MSWMFYDCQNLIKIDLSSFDTQNVIDMSYTFYGCKNLINIDLSQFNTKNIKNITYIFWGYGNLIKINRKNFRKVKTDLELNNSQLSIYPLLFILTYIPSPMMNQEEEDQLQLKAKQRH